MIAAARVLNRLHLLLDDWRSYVLAFFALVWVANVYMSIYNRLRVGTPSERALTDAHRQEAAKIAIEKQSIECELRERQAHHQDGKTEKIAART